MKSSEQREILQLNEIVPWKEKKKVKIYPAGEMDNI